MNHTYDSNQKILYATVGALQPGGICLSWIAGLTACEALRLTQRFDQNTSKCRRFFVYFGLAMVVSMAGVLAVITHHYCVVNYGNYERLTAMTNVVRCHLLLGKIATVGGMLFYCQLLWNTDLGRVKALRVPIFRLLILLIVFISTVMNILAVLRLFSFKTMELVRGRDAITHWIARSQFICEVTLTLFKAYDLAKSNSTRQVLIYKDNPLRYAYSVLCLLCQTAFIPSIFGLILVCQPGMHSPGISFTLISLSAELHIFGPIMAISAALDSDCLNDSQSTCSIARHEYDGDKPKPIKHLTFQ